MTHNKNRGDIFTIKCLKCGDIENISTRVISTGKYKGCKKCYEKHCRVCGKIMHGYWKEDICKECKKEIEIEREKSKIRKCICCGKEFNGILGEICGECGNILSVIIAKITRGKQCECCGEIFIPGRNRKYC